MAVGTHCDSAAFHFYLQSGQLSPATNCLLQSQMACGVKQQRVSLIFSLLKFTTLPQGKCKSISRGESHLEHLSPDT